MIALLDAVYGSYTLEDGRLYLTDQTGEVGLVSDDGPTRLIQVQAERRQAGIPTRLIYPDREVRLWVNAVGQTIQGINGELAPLVSQGLEAAYGTHHPAIRSASQALRRDHDTLRWCEWALGDVVVKRWIEALAQLDLVTARLLPDLRTLQTALEA